MNDIRRKQRSYSADGEYDKPDRGTTGTYKGDVFAFPFNILLSILQFIVVKQLLQLQLIVKIPEVTVIIIHKILLINYLKPFHIFLIVAILEVFYLMN